MWLTILLLLIITIKLYNKITSGKCYSDAILTGKVAIVTGSSSGIGYKTAKDLALRGAKVILACHDETKGKIAQASIIKTTKNNNVEYANLDLASFDSIGRFVKTFKDRRIRLDILVNNASVDKGKSEYTQDGILEVMQINHYGAFLLTLLLVPVMRKSGNGRIINVSSLLHRFGVLDFEKINMENYYGSFQMYYNSKLCNVLFTKELARRLSDTEIVVNSVHPGFVRTRTFVKNSSLFDKLGYIVHKLFFKSRSDGAQTLIYLATSDECDDVSGKHFADCRETTVSNKAQDPDLASMLWSHSENAVKLRPEERI